MTLKQWLAALCFAVAPALSGHALAADAVTPKDILVEPPTLHCIGIEWNVDGDANENATCAVRYRVKGEAAWKDAQPLLRVENMRHKGATARLTYDVPFGNMLAGSIFFLEPDTSYEVELALTDPDGGAETKVVEVKTRAVPQAAKDARIVQVGGPQELPQALAAAAPGDIILLAAGEYDAFTVTKDGEAGRPIVVRGADAAKVVVTGKTELSGRKYVHLENVTVAGSVEMGNSDGVVVQGCTISGDEIGIHGGKAQNCYIADNTIIGRNNWEVDQRNSAGGVGIKVNGNGAVICYNTIREHWDNISLFVGNQKNADGSNPICSMDIYGNDLQTGSDDGIEADYLNHNIRVFKNRFTNTGSAISFQPLYGGPAYIMFNEIYNTRIKPFKWHVSPSGLFAYHNTSFSSWTGWSCPEWRNGVLMNNIIFANANWKGAQDNNVVKTDFIKGTFDYNGYNQGAGGFMRLNSKQYANLEEAAKAGFEQHGVMLDLGAFEKAQYPFPGRSNKEPYGPPHKTDEFDLRLKAGSPAIDAGKPLANINDGFTGAAPDLGCYEFGKPIPHYGVRPVK